MRLRHRYLALALVLAVLLAVGIAVGVTSVMKSAHRGEPVVVDAACPPLLRGTSSSTQDFAAVLYWGGRELVATDDEASPGDQVGAVTCSVLTMDNPNGWRVTGDRWPDGTAVDLEKGTPLFAAEGRATNAVVARTGTGDVLYCVADDQLRPAC